MAISKDAEKLVSQVENGEGAKYGRDARKYAVDSWKIHTGEWPAPKAGKTPTPSWTRPQRPSPSEGQKVIHNAFSIDSLV